MAGWKPLVKELSEHVVREHNDKTRTRQVHRDHTGAVIATTFQVTEHTFSGSNRASRRAAGNYRGFAEKSGSTTKKVKNAAH